MIDRIDYQKIDRKYEQDAKIEAYKKVICDYVKDLKKQAVQDMVSKL